MKINRDLVDATLMLSFIVLVLVGTTDLSNRLLKEVIIGGFALLGVAMAVLRFILMRRETHRNAQP